MKNTKDKKPTAFVLFVEEWRQLRQSSLEWQECIHLAGPAWQHMSLDQRQPYINKAKQLRTNNNKNGIILDINSNQENFVMEQIESLVRRSVERKELESQNYCFLMVNYFTKDIYTPAELAIVQFSLLNGVQNIYHTLINPGVGLYRALAETQEHVFATHQLPLPPNALGNKDIGSVYADIRNFARSEPVFTLKQYLPMVRGALKYLNNGVDSQLCIYPIECLFHLLKVATCEAAKLPIPESMHETNDSFKRNPHEMLPNLSCEFHEQRQLGKHCARSIVTRWGFTFAENICSDLAISMRPNRHMPGNVMEETPLSDISPDPSQDINNAEDDPLNGIVTKEAMLDFNAEAVELLNSLDLDSLFDEEELAALPLLPPKTPEELMFENQVTPEDSFTDIDSPVEDIPETLKAVGNEIVSKVIELKSDHGKQGSKSPESVDTKIKELENRWRTKSRDDRSSQKTRVQERKSDHGKHVPSLEHKSSRSSNGWHSKSSSRSRDDGSLSRLSTKRQVAEREIYNSNNRSDHGKRRSKSAENVHPIIKELEKRWRQRSRDERSSHKRQIQKWKSGQRKHVSPSGHKSPKSPKGWTSKSRSRSREDRAFTRHIVERKANSFNQRIHISPSSHKSSKSPKRWPSKSRSRSRSFESFSRLMERRRFNYNRTDRGKIRSPSRSPRSRRSKSRSRSRGDRSFDRFSRRRHLEELERPSTHSRLSGTQYLSSTSPEPDWHLKSRSRSRERYPTNRRTPPKSPDYFRSKRIASPRVMLENRHISPPIGFGTRKRSVSPKRRRRDLNRLARSPSFSPSRVIRERVPHDSPKRNSLTYRSVENNSNRSQYTRDVSLSKCTESKSSPESNEFRPSDMHRKSNSQFGKQSKITTIINTLEVSSGSRTTSIPTHISTKPNSNEDFETYKYGSPPSAYYEKDFGDYLPPERISPHDLRHRLGMPRSNYMLATDLRYRIQERQPDISPRQMNFYAQEQYPAYGNHRETWENYESPQWHNEYENYVEPRNYY